MARAAAASGKRTVTTSVEPPLMAALKTKMRWHEARQAVLAENVTNASTVGYQAHDLRPVEAEDGGVGVARTAQGHMTLASSAGVDRDESRTTFERTPDGNSVVLEEQMIKAAQNQMDHQMAATLYAKSLGLLRTALGRG